MEKDVVLVCFPVAMTNTMSKAAWGGKGVWLSGYSSSPRDAKLEEYCVLACSARFFKHPWATGSGMALPTVGWALLYQSVSNQENAPQTCLLGQSDEK